LQEKLVAVVVSFNRLEQLKKTVSELKDQGVDHILVVDNASTDGSIEWLETQTELTLALMEENRGGAGGFEFGMRMAMRDLSPDWLLLMDEDARPKPGAIAFFRAMQKTNLDLIGAAVTYPSGEICEMNRPVYNPFGSFSAFFGTMFKGRRGFHSPDEDYQSKGTLPVDGVSFVGLFIRAKAVAEDGYPDGRLFIYGDDTLYTLGLNKKGRSVGFAPEIGFEHDCGTIASAGVFMPLWKNYYRFRNLSFVYRLAAGPILFWPVLALMSVRWSMWSRSLPHDQRYVYRKIRRLAISDAVRKNTSRDHDEIVLLGTPK